MKKDEGAPTLTLTAVQSVAWFPKEDEAALEHFQRWVQALGYIVKGHLRQGKGLQEDLKVCHEPEHGCPRHFGCIHCAGLS